MANAEKINSFLSSLFGYERAKSKSHILVIVLIHVACWCLVFFLPVLLYPVRFNNRLFVSRELVEKSVLVVIFYLNYYFLIPRFFERKRYALYFSWILLLFVLYLSQQVIVRNEFIKRTAGPFMFFQLATPSTSSPDSMMYTAGFIRTDSFSKIHPRGGNMSFAEGIATNDTSSATSKGFPPPPFPEGEPYIFGVPRGIFFMSLNNSVSSFSLLMLIGGFIRLAYSFVRSQDEKKALENANLNAEVNFLKSQINPHFLFNTLNSIYSQAHSRSANTEFSILKLSELLRYVLYDSGENRVALADDIQYINNYIALQRLRLSPKITLHYEVTGDALTGKMIAPLLLISFIENAFKHGISYTHASTVEISIDVFEETLTLSVTNPIVEKDSFGPGGLGLKNVTRRLELLYPGQHQLDIHRRDDLHIVNLKLKLTHA
jgi:two-component system, LytTR family, sensor kinase